MAFVLVVVLLALGGSAAAAAEECKTVGKGCYDPCQGSECFVPGTQKNGFACCPGSKCHVFSVTSQGSSGVCIPNTLTTGCLAEGQHCDLGDSALSTPCCGAGVCAVYDWGTSGPFGRCGAATAGTTASPPPAPSARLQEEASRAVPRPPVATAPVPSPSTQPRQQGLPPPPPNAAKSPAAAKATKGPSAGVLVGAAFGAAILLAIVAGAAFLPELRRRKRRQALASSNNSSPAAGAPATAGYDREQQPDLIRAGSA
jgi:hypothetical protein